MEELGFLPVPKIVKSGLTCPIFVKINFCSNVYMYHDRPVLSKVFLMFWSNDTMFKFLCFVLCFVSVNAFVLVNIFMI